MSDGYKELEAIFENREYKTGALDNARKNSVGVDRVEKQSHSEFIDLAVIKELVVGLALTAMVLAVSVGFVNGAKEKFNYQMNNVSIEIGALIQDSSKDKASIVSQNTFRNGDTVFYSQDAIARGLLNIDSSLFDYAFCAVCNDMGANINNKVGIGDMSNIDSVIYFLKLYSSVDGGFFNEYVRSAFENVNSLDDYLIKNGYVDKAGNPSLAVFKDACDKNSEAVYDIVQSQIQSKGVGRA